MEPLYSVEMSAHFTTERRIKILREPIDIGELDELIKSRMLTVGRCLDILVGDFREEPRPWWADVYQQLTTLACFYRPWQYSCMSQLDGSFEAHWVEVDEWLDKYKS